MAKIISAVENNPQGRKILQYLIDVEEAWNDPEQVIKRAMQTGKVFSEEAVKELEAMYRSVQGYPFPGRDRQFTEITSMKMFTMSKGGRVYVVGTDRRSTHRDIFAFDANGQKAGQGICMQSHQGLPVGDHLSRFLDGHKAKLGVNQDMKKDAPLDDYVDWIGSLIKAKHSGNALPPPPTGELDYNGPPIDTSKHLGLRKFGGPKKLTRAEIEDDHGGISPRAFLSGDDEYDEKDDDDMEVREFTPEYIAACFY